MEQRVPFPLIKRYLNVKNEYYPRDGVGMSVGGLPIYLNGNNFSFVWEIEMEE